jgi:hypothetical protein
VTDRELADKLLWEHRNKEAAQKKAAEEEEKRLKGYRFWCSEGCGFVDRWHRCEQWTHITYIPPEAVEAIKAETRSRGGK